VHILTGTHGWWFPARKALSHPQIIAGRNGYLRLSQRSQRSCRANRRRSWSVICSCKKLRTLALHSSPTRDGTRLPRIKRQRSRSRQPLDPTATEQPRRLF
jgi:hypothetical protein